MTKLNWERPKRGPAGPKVFTTRYQARCMQCEGFMPPGSKAVKLPVGVMHAEHAVGATR